MKKSAILATFLLACLAFVSCNDLISVDPPEVIEEMDMSYTGDVEPSQLENIDGSSINWITQEQLDANAGNIAGILGGEYYGSLSEIFYNMKVAANPLRSIGFYGNIQATISDEKMEYGYSMLDINKVNLKLSGAVSSVDAFTQFIDNEGESVSVSFTDSIGVEFTTDYNITSETRDFQCNSMLKLNVTGEDFTYTVSDDAYEGKLSLYIDGEISLGATFSDLNKSDLYAKIIMSVSFDELDVELDMADLYKYIKEENFEEIQKMILGEGESDSKVINITAYNNDNEEIASGSYSIIEIMDNFK